jgi:inner membrane protein
MVVWKNVPTPVAHTLAGATIALLANRKGPLDAKLFLATVVTASLPDIDFGISYLVGRNLHHHFTHGIGSAALVSGAVFVASRALSRPHAVRNALILGASYLSHLGLDLFSTDTAPPYGLQLLWPFSDEFYISPVLLFDDVWRGTLAKLFGMHNWLAVLREVAVVGPPAAIVLWWWRRRPEAARRR